MSTINAIPAKVFYDPQAWIDLAPDHDWGKLVPEPPAPESEPEPEPEAPEPDPEPEPEAPEPDPEPDPEEPPA